MVQYIKKITKKHTKPKNVAYADFETISILGKAYVFAIGFFFKKKYCYFYVDIKKKTTVMQLINESYKIMQEFHEHCFLLPKGSTIYFHNLSSFDGYFITNYLLDKDIKFQMIMRNNKILKIKVKNIKFMDSLLMLNDTLDNIAKKFLKKEKIKLDVDFTFTRIINEKAKILQYLKNDVNILRDSFNMFIKKIWEIYEINVTRCLTIPSLSLIIFRKNFYKKGNIEILNNFIYKYIKKGFFGGLNEVFIPQGRDLKQYDVNSLYPFAMKNYPMPTQVLGWKKKSELFLLKERNLSNFFGFAFVKIKIPNNFIIGPLGKRMKNGKLSFPVGTVQGVYFSEEIKFALEVGCTLEKIYNALEMKAEYIFENFVDHFYKQKQNSDGCEKYLFKLILNSLYGRFGMGRGFQEVVEIDKENLNTYQLCSQNFKVLKIKENKKYIIQYTYVQDDKKKKELKKWGSSGLKHLLFLNKMDYKLSHMNSCVALSAAITCYSRIKMLKDIYTLSTLMNIYYIDTDSLVTDQYIPEELCGNMLGKYKLEHDHSDGIFLTSKVYILKYKKIVFKGLKKEITFQLDWEWFERQLEKNRKYTFIWIQKIKRVLTKFTILTNIKKKYSPLLKLDKRIKIFDAQGRWITTRPLFLEEKHHQKEAKYFCTFQKIFNIGYLTFFLKKIYNIYKKNFKKKGTY